MKFWRKFRDNIITSLCLHFLVILFCGVRSGLIAIGGKCMREWKDWLSGETGGCYSCAVSDILCNLVWISIFSREFVTEILKLLCEAIMYGLTGKL